MSLSTLSINRPVLATVFSLIIIVVGLVSFNKLPVREYPDIDPPVVTITTVYAGANSEVIESEITDLIEEELTGVDGVRTMTSTSRDQVSSITVEFNLDRDVDIAAQDVRDKVSRIAARLPENANEPEIAKSDSDSQPIMWILIKSDSRSLIDLSDFAEREIKDILQNVSGVSKVIFGGERRKSIQILIDPKKVAYYGLTVLDIEKSLKNNNINLPAGRIESSSKEFSINIDGRLLSVDEYMDLTIKSDNKFGLIKVRDIATILEGAENDRSFVRFNGQQGFGFGIVRQSKSNTIEIAKGIKRRIEQLKDKLPEDVKIDVGYDASVFIKLSLDDLYNTIAQATLLVLLIIFMFLRNFRSTIIPAVSIPVSLIGVMAGLSVFGFTLNLMTLLGLIIAVGIVVDDSIIVLENITRYIEEGMDPIEAAKKGANEITLAVIATTLVLISIFLPIGFLAGVTGRLLSEFAFTLCFATSISSFVALTAVPMLCSKMLKPNENKAESGFKLILENMFVSWENSYASLLKFFLNHKNILLSITLIISLGLGYICFNFVPSDFIPKEDRGSFFTIVQSPRGSNIDYTDTQIRRVENELLKNEDIETVISVAAFGFGAPGKVTDGIIINRLKDWRERSKHSRAMVGPLYGVFGAIAEAFVLPIMPSSGPGNGFGGQDIQFVVRTNDIDFLTKYNADLLARQAELSSIQFMRSDFSYDKPELKVEINRQKAAQLGVSVQDISKSLEILFTGIDLTEFNDNGEKYQVIARLPKEQKLTKNKIGEIGVRSSEGAMVQLSNLITISESIGFEERNHFNRKKSITFSASPNPGTTLATGLEELEALAIKLAESYESKPLDLEFDYKGTAKELKDANIALLTGFLLALVFAYLFLAGQFESFRSPILIMLTVPLALVGALAGLAILKLPALFTTIATSFGAPFWIKFIIPQFPNMSLNIYSQVGLIMLVGMASKNGILMVEFMNELRKQGLPILEVVNKAAILRLRPILMTAFSTVLGILPIALALGIGSESRQSLGVAVVFGMSVSTFLTLFILPAAYYLTYRHSNK